MPGFAASYARLQYPYLHRRRPRCGFGVGVNFTFGIGERNGIGLGQNAELDAFPRGRKVLHASGKAKAVCGGFFPGHRRRRLLAMLHIYGIGFGLMFRKFFPFFRFGFFQFFFGIGQARFHGFGISLDLFDFLALFGIRLFAGFTLGVGFLFFLALAFGFCKRLPVMLVTKRVDI